MISGATRLVALLGQPVAGSLSPRMQNAAFAARGLDWAYVACEVAPERLGPAVEGLVALGFAGANVTAPHKRAAAALCDEAEGAVVNTLALGHQHRPRWSRAASGPRVPDRQRRRGGRRSPGARG